MVLRFEVRTNFPKNADELADKAIQHALQEITFTARRKASLNAPYDTGTLRRSITEAIEK